VGILEDKGMRAGPATGEGRTMQMFKYAVRYRRQDNPSRVYHVTLTARNADEARAYAAIRDPLFHSTVTSPKRRAEVVPVPPDPIDEAKRREWIATLDGGRHGDIEVEVV
jgi:hypothetical protein